MERSGRSKVQLAAAERTTVLQVLCIGRMCAWGQGRLGSKMQLGAVCVWGGSGGSRECVNVTQERSTLLQALCLGMRGGVRENSIPSTHVPV